MEITKVFQADRSQAVRLPKALSYESPVVPTDARKFAASKRLV